MRYTVALTRKQAELYKARGASDDARRVEEQLSKTWAGDRILLQLSRL
jgi:hypothetical protein